MLHLHQRPTHWIENVVLLVAITLGFIWMRDCGGGYPQHPIFVEKETVAGHRGSRTHVKPNPFDGQFRIGRAAL